MAYPQYDTVANVHRKNSYGTRKGNVVRASLTASLIASFTVIALVCPHNIGADQATLGTSSPAASLTALVATTPPASAPRPTDQPTLGTSSAAASHTALVATAPPTSAPHPKGDYVDLFTALATLVGAGLGFGAALWVERQSWERRKAEQIRQEQLTKLLSAARGVQQAKDRLAACKHQFATTKQSVRAPNHATLKAQASADAAATCAHLQDKVTELRLEHLELRVLRIAPEALEEISQAITAITKAIEILRPAAINYGPVEEEAVLAAEISLEGLIGTALDGLLRK